jgi:hypothetical protein
MLLAVRADVAGMMLFADLPSRYGEEGAASLAGSQGAPPSTVTALLVGAAAGAGIATLGAVLWVAYHRRQQSAWKQPSCEDSTQLRAMRISHSARV